MFWFSKKKTLVKSQAAPKNFPRPTVLIVLDGWGVMQAYSGNAISQAKTPNMSAYVKKYPTTTLSASGEFAGLPWGEMGNSEVGHLNLGMGKIPYQDLPKINRSIIDEVFYENETLLKAAEHVKKNKSSLHFMGLISEGCVHSSIKHLNALLDFAKRQKIDKVFIHAFLDGRDAPFNSGVNYVREAEEYTKKHGLGKISTLSGRFYAMDRDNRWPRIEKAYLAITAGEGERAESAVAAVEASYKKKIYDEEFAPTIIGSVAKNDGLVSDNDAVIFFNYRPDRARQITSAFVSPDFNYFKRPEKIKNLFFAGFTEYEKDLPAEIVFPPEEIKDTLGETISGAGLKQLRIAETEKYAHVTYFFNGGEEIQYEGEDRELVPSPKVESYALKPEMSAPEVTSRLLKAIESDKYDFILVNYANADMVGHTGDLAATIKAVEAVDDCVGKVVKSVLAKDGCVVITADHGNAEIVFNMQTNTVDKEHSTNPVPFIVISNKLEGKNFGSADALGGDLSLIAPQGILADVAPTILKIMNMEKPSGMEGKSFL